MQEIDETELNLDWSWSGEIDITSSQKVSFQLRKIREANFKYLKAEISNTQGLIYVKLEEYKSGFEPYHLESTLDSDFNVILCQDCEKSTPFPLRPGVRVPYCWDQPCDRKLMKITINDEKGEYHQLSQSIIIDKIDSKTSFLLKAVDRLNKNDLTIQVVTSIENQSKKIQIRKQEQKKKEVINLESEAQNGKNFKELVLSLRISYLGVSVIQNWGGRKTRELLYLTFKNVEFCRVDTIKTRVFQIKIGYVNMDNNQSYLVNFPVLLTPSEPEKLKELGYFLNFFIEKSRKHEELDVFRSIKLDVQAVSIKVEDSEIPQVLDFWSDISEMFWPAQTTLNDTNTGYLFRLNKNERPENWFWESDEISNSSQHTFIDELILAPIKLNFSFLSKSKLSGKAFLSAFFKAFGVAMMNIDDAPIKLKGIRLENCFDTTWGIFSTLLKHYMNSFSTEVLKLLGSMNIIGNPVGLFSQIGTGVQDFIEKPLEGIIKGPLEGGVGLVKGAGSLIKHTFAGTFNSVDKITDSLGSGIAFLSFDEEYLAQREKMKFAKPKHVGEGLKHAGLSIFKGLEKGITGVFLKPFEGASKDGVKGFLKGTYMGVTGLIIKPVSGVLDAASKTAEGIKNTALGNDDRPSEMRQRLIRVFYSFDQFYQDYDEKDAELNYFLQVELKKGKFADENYFFGYLFGDEEGEHNVLLVTSDSLIYFNRKNMKKKWIVETSKIEEVCEREDGFIEIIFQEYDVI